MLLNQHHKEETRKKMSESRKRHLANGGKVNCGMQGRKHSMRVRKLISKAQKGVPNSEETRRRISQAKKGSKSHFWKGGISIENKRIRASLEFRLWRESVFRRDNWTCQECKIRGGELHPHHIKPFALFPELRFAIDNGLTLCVGCHKKTDTWGRPTKNQ